MYRIVLGKVSTLSAAPLPPGLREQAPQGPRRERWLAGRALLSHTLSPLPEIIYGEQGKPAFAPETPLWFNLSHSVDSTYHSSLSVSHCQLENLSLAICTPTPFTLTADSVQWIDSVN